MIPVHEAIVEIDLTMYPILRNSYNLDVAIAKLGKNRIDIVFRLPAKPFVRIIHGTFEDRNFGADGHVGIEATEDAVSCVSHPSRIDDLRIHALRAQQCLKLRRESLAWINSRTCASSVPRAVGLACSERHDNCLVRERCLRTDKKQERGKKSRSKSPRIALLGRCALDRASHDEDCAFGNLAGPRQGVKLVRLLEVTAVLRPRP